MAVVDEGGFGAAAARLGITQQGVSKRIGALERQLGVPLLHRKGTLQRPTEAGSILLRRSREILRLLDEAVDDLRPGRRPLRVAALDEWLAPARLVRAAKRLQPGLHLDVTTGLDPDDIGASLAAGEVDAAFGWPRPVDAAHPWQRRLISSEELRLIVPAGHPLARRTAIRPRDLDGAKVWFPSKGAPGAWLDFLDEWSASQGIETDLQGSTIGFAGFLDEIAGGRVSVYGSAMPAVDHRAVQVVPLIEPVPLVCWWLLWRPDAEPEAVRGLLSALETVDAGPPIEDLDDPRYWLPQRDRGLLSLAMRRRISALGELPEV